ncbi:hypothetical protein UFO1_4165 [Pelosinus sp. UFO1]|nr:hypothetical protein UFO1_4165 [Pelosinus sp. UFO1]
MKRQLKIDETLVSHLIKKTFTEGLSVFYGNKYRKIWDFL